jgi:transcriptional regulator with XRE-family HTH domain
MSKKEQFSAQLTRFGRNLRRERNARAITQEKLAEMADLNIRTVQEIESGTLNILITTAMRLQKALSCSFNQLFS